MAAFQKSNKLIVQKYGGATLADPQKIQAIAHKIYEQYKNGDNLVVVVSAMGKTTNQLIDLAHQVSTHPRRRELDMLLSTGERISMSLLSMALNDLGCPAISFTGSQAGVLTDDSHQNAFIKEVKPFRIQEAIKERKVVVLAGFQGVSPITKEITTLGRGGSDTTAVAMAAALNADRCEILKDVPAVFTADPNIVKDAKAIHNLNYAQLLEMTFWGAKVLHYRSVELGQKQKVALYIGPAHSTKEGTMVMEKTNAFESTEIISLNSHELVLKISAHGPMGKSLETFQDYLIKKEIAFPQMLYSQTSKSGFDFFLTGPAEILSAITKELSSQKEFLLSEDKLSTISATCMGSTTPEVATAIIKQLELNEIPTYQVFLSALSTTVVVEQSKRVKALEVLHSLIGKNFSR